VVGNIISEIAPYLGIATDGIDRSQNTVKVPNLVGKEWSNAQVSLNTKGLKHQLVESESDQTAAVGYTGDYRSLAMGFPFEAIVDEGQRDRLMQQIMNFLEPRK